MEVQKRNSKGGGFLNLFDWNGKSRRKLFSDSSNGPESAHQGKVKLEILPGPRLLQTNAAGENPSSSNSGRLDWNCNPNPSSSSSSSLTSCNGRGNNAPGVVARLMGLDSMPTPNAPKSGSTSSPDFNLPRGAQYYNKPEGFTRDSRIERFQTEILPPRSAKPISVTHHKLLSPIKNPAFVPTKNAAHIMEAAARIIKASPREAVMGKVGPTISSSLPLRIQDLKMKLEAQQPKRPNNFNIVRGKSNDMSALGMRDSRVMRREVESERGNTSRSSSSKTRPLFPAEQAKGSMQRREGKGQTLNRNLPSEREFMSSQRRDSTNRTGANVLKQNNRKQNLFSDGFGSRSKASSVPHIGPNKARTANKVPTRTESMSSKTVRTNTPRNLSSSSYSSTKPLSQRKVTADRETSSMRSIATNVLISNDERAAKRNLGTDVISFTFTSPIKRSSEAHSPVQAVTNVNGFASGRSLTFPSPAESMIGESSLSILLEQKLRELKDRVEYYIQDGSFTSTSSLKEEEEEEDSLSTCTSSIQYPVSTTNHLRSAKVGADVEEMNGQSDFDYSSTVDWRQKFQAQSIEAMEEYSPSATARRTGKGVDCQLPSASDLEPLLAQGSSPDSTVTSSGKEESMDLLSTTEFLEVEDNRTELSDTISSSSFADIRESHVSLALLTGTNFNQSSNWEIEYISDILGEANPMLEDFSSAHPGEIINPSLFDELESRGNRDLRNNEEETVKLRRKILFDFVSECLGSRCQDLLIGTPKGWARFTKLFWRKRLLAEEIYRDASGGNCIGDMMVDVLVDEDMSSRFGRWVDFRVEMFEEGADLVQCLLSSLVDELVAEFTVLSC